MSSKRWNINIEDIRRVSRNALIFTTPVIITWLTMLQNGVTDGNQYIQVAQVWALGVALDFFRKLAADNTK